MTSDGFSLKRCILDAIFSGMIALIIFGPIAGVILDGYSFTFDGQRLAWIGRHGDAGTLFAERLFSYGGRKTFTGAV
ncbi:hypothetical protein ACLB6M_02600 [Enterobacter hormaechei]